MISLKKQKLFIVLNRARAKAKQQDEAKQILDRLYKAVGIIQHHDYYVMKRKHTPLHAQPAIAKIGNIIT